MPRKRGSQHHQRMRQAVVATPQPAESQPPPEGRGRRLILLGIVLLVAACLRLRGLADRDLWFDELGAVLLATSGDLWLTEGGNPPLFFALLRGAIGALGVDVAAVRMLPALAGLAGVAALFWVATELDLPPSVRWWGAVLFACSPLQLYYAQEARAYALLVLLLLLSIGSFLRALRTGSSWWWTAHGACVVAGLYTHNMMIPMVGAFWTAALLLRLSPHQWRTLAAVHGLAIVAYGPWLPRLFEQTSGESHLWIAELVRGVSVVQLTTGTLEAFNIGGRLPGHLDFPAGRGTAVWSALLFGVACVMTMAAAVRKPATSRSARLRRSIAVLAIFTIWPIVFLVLYTQFERPLYVVGRYDLPAHPPYLLLVALGLHEIARRLRAWGRLAALLPAAALVTLTACTLAPKLARRPSDHPSDRLTALFAARATPGDLVVALDISEPLAHYAVLRSRLALKAERFPAERLDHLDQASLDRRVLANVGVYQRQAADLAARARGRRIWLVESEGYGSLHPPQTAYEALKFLLITELRHHRAGEITGPAPRKKRVSLFEPL